MSHRGYRGLRQLTSLGTLFSWARDVVTLFNNVIIGKLNVTYDHDNDFTLTASVATTTLSDKRIGVESNIIFTPRTANASAEIGAGTIYINEPGDGSVVINHANNAQTDRTFRVTIIG